MPTTFEDTFLPEIQMATPCMTCLREKAADGDVEATAVINLIKFIAEYMACRFLTEDSSMPCSDRDVKAIPSEVQRQINSSGYTSGSRLDLLVGGLVHRVIEDEDWETP